MKAKFSVFRRECLGGYSTRGPVAQEMDFDAARKEIVHLKSLYPHQDFVIMREIGEATRSERMRVKIVAPDLSSFVRKKRKAAFSPNVIPLRNAEVG